jgi:hypothetical protein
VNGPFSGRDFQFYDEVFAFLEAAHAVAGEYREGELEEESPRDLFLLSFTKVLNDCRAILALAEGGFYLQGAIVLRSTADACNLMMHIAFAGEQSEVAERWLRGERLKHWDVVKHLNEVLGDENGLNLKAYEETRRRLDDVVHGNFLGLKLYPAQAPGPTPVAEGAVARLTFWTPLLDLCIVSCLMTVGVVTDEGTQEAGHYLEAVLDRMSVGGEAG